MARGGRRPIIRRTTRHLMRAYYRWVEPVFTRLRRPSRLLHWTDPPAHVELSLLPARATTGFARLLLGRAAHIGRRYDMGFLTQPCRHRARLVLPMVIDLARFADKAAFERHLRACSSRNLYKIRKAGRLGYEIARFDLATYAHDVHAIRTSRIMRSCGPMIASLFLKPEHIARPPDKARPPPTPRCNTHWSTWWGVFEPRPGHRNGALTTDRRLVAYINVARYGELAHYFDIMGHNEHLRHSVMLMLHHHLVVWFLDAREPAAQGVRAIWYGGLEQGGAGLMTWKQRSGFVPAIMDIKRDDGDAGANAAGD